MEHEELSTYEIIELEKEGDWYNVLKDLTEEVHSIDVRQVQVMSSY